MTKLSRVGVYDADAKSIALIVQERELHDEKGRLIAPEQEAQAYIDHVRPLSATDRNLRVVTIKEVAS